MLKSLVPALLIAGASMTAVQAADGDKLIGFEFGVGYHLVDDSRYDGTDVNFGLVIPVGQKFDIVVYHEIGRYYGKQDGDRSQAETETTELRFRITAWEGESQAVKLVLGMGSSDLNVDDFNDTESAPIADLGVQFVVMKAKSGPVKGEIALNAVYRYFRFEDSVNGDLNDEINKFGGFIIGVNAGLYF